MRIPVFDAYVREFVGVTEWGDLPQQYQAVARKVLAQAQAIRTDDPALLASMQPQVPLRVIDKVFWWLGGGNRQAA